MFGLIKQSCERNTEGSDDIFSAGSCLKVAPLATPMDGYL